MKHRCLGIVGAVLLERDNILNVAPHEKINFICRSESRATLKVPVAHSKSVIVRFLAK